MFVLAPKRKIWESLLLELKKTLGHIPVIGGWEDVLQKQPQIAYTSIRLQMVKR